MKVSKSGYDSSKIESSEDQNNNIRLDLKNLQVREKFLNSNIHKNAEMLEL